MSVHQDFESDGPVRYTHRTQKDLDIYFVSNTTTQTVNTLCTFRVNDGTPELWDPLTGETRLLPDFKLEGGRVKIPLQFDAYQSYFVVFSRNEKAPKANLKSTKNFPDSKVLVEVNGPWKVSFNPKWGGPASSSFDKLTDWTTRPEEGIKYYSGIATYQQTVKLTENTIADKNTEVILDLGEVYNLARIYVNGKDMGVVWTAPYRVKISDALVSGENQIKIEVANLWPNRLIGDEQKADDGIQNRQWPEWLVKNQPRTSGRYTFTTGKFYKKDSELLKSGLIGPVRILVK